MTPDYLSNTFRRLERVQKLLTLFTIISCFLLFFSLPIIVFIVEYNQIKSNVQFRSELISKKVSEFATLQGSTWFYSSGRLPELIKFGDPEGLNLTTVFYRAGAETREVIAIGTPQVSPTIVLRSDVISRSKNVGVIQVEHSLYPSIYSMLLSSLVSGPIAVALYFTFLILPKRSLSLASQALNKANQDLNQEIRFKEKETLRANHASKAKSNFLANMSHEMRTPLNAIIGFSQIIKDGIVGDLPAIYKEYGADIFNSGMHLLNLTNTLLDLAKIENKQTQVDFSPFKIKDVIFEAIKMIKIRAEEKKLEIEQDFGTCSELQLTSDRMKIFQSIVNILTNAIKYTPDNGKVTVFLEQTITDVFVIIEDTGIGMSEGELKEAMEPFGKISNSYTADIEGTGLGLEITRQYLQLLSGEMSISSQSGVGTRVTIKIPKA